MYIIVQIIYNFSFVDLCKDYFIDYLQVLEWVGFYKYGDPLGQLLDEENPLYEQNRQWNMLKDILFFILLLLLRNNCYQNMEELPSQPSESSKSSNKKESFQDKMSKFIMTSFQNTLNFIKNMMRIIFLVLFFLISLQKSDVNHLLYLIMVIYYLIFSSIDFNRHLLAFVLLYTCVSIISTSFSIFNPRYLSLSDLSSGFFSFLD